MHLPLPSIKFSVKMASNQPRKLSPERIHQLKAFLTNLENGKNTSINRLMNTNVQMDFDQDFVRMLRAKKLLQEQKNLKPRVKHISGPIEFGKLVKLAPKKRKHLNEKKNPPSKRRRLS